MKRNIKHVFYILIILLIVGCDYQGSYSFIVNNATEKTIKLRFIDTTSYNYQSGNHNDNNPFVVLLKGEEKTIRIIDAPLNSPAHDCLKEHGMTYFRSLAFDTYIDDKNIEKQLWLPENWIYHKASKWSADYKLTLTNELINKK